MKKKLVAIVALLAMASLVKADNASGSWFDQIKEALRKAQEQSQETRQSDSYRQPQSSSGSWLDQIKEALRKAQQQSQDTKPADTYRQPQQSRGWLDRLNDLFGQKTQDSDTQYRGTRYSDRTYDDENYSAKQRELERQAYEREQARQKLQSGWEQLKDWGRQIFGNRQ